MRLARTCECKCQYLEHPYSIPSQSNFLISTYILNTVKDLVTMILNINLNNFANTSMLEYIPSSI